MLLIYVFIPVMALLLVSAQATWGSAIKNDHLLAAPVGQVIINLATSPKIWGGIFLYAATTGLYFYMLSKVPFFNIQVSMTALAVLFSTALAVVLFHENISPLNFFGAFLVVAGLWLVLWR